MAGVLHGSARTTPRVRAERLLHELFEAAQRADGGARVQRANAAGVASAPRLDQVERLGAKHSTCSGPSWRT